MQIMALRVYDYISFSFLCFALVSFGFLWFPLVLSHVADRTRTTEIEKLKALLGEEDEAEPEEVSEEQQPGSKAAPKKLRGLNWTSPRLSRKSSSERSTWT